jgi:hypothetical protein
MTCNIGACCKPDYSCDITTQGLCDEALGTYTGNNTPCTPDPCAYISSSSSSSGPSPWILAGTDTFADGYKSFSCWGNVPQGATCKVVRLTAGNWVNWKINDWTGYEWTFYPGTEVEIGIWPGGFVARCYYYYGVPIEFALYYKF